MPTSSASFRASFRSMRFLTGRGRYWGEVRRHCEEGQGPDDAIQAQSQHSVIGAVHMAMVVHDKGISRVNPPNVQKGNWYYGFKCTECKAAIPVFNNPDKSIESRITGSGKFSVPCPSCGIDEIIYGTADVIAIQADKDIITSPAWPKTLPQRAQC